jgi:hypothetical protein
LAHFTVGSPPQVAVPGISEVEACNLLETARRVETGSEFVGERFVMKEAVCSGRADRPFVEPHRLGIAALDACELGADERGAVFEVFRAVLGPLLELAMVGRQCLVVLGTIRGGCRIAERSPRQRAVKLVVCLLKDCRHHPPKSVCVLGRRDGGNVGTREKARLQLPEPVQVGDEREARVFGQLLLETALVELGIVEGAELRSEAAKGLDEPEVRTDQVEDDSEPESAREIEPSLGLALDISERFPGCEEAGDEADLAETREGDVADSVGRVDGAPRQAEAGTDGLRPVRDGREQIVDLCLEAMQPALLHQVQAELPEAEPGPVIPNRMPRSVPSQT